MTKIRLPASNWQGFPEWEPFWLLPFSFKETGFAFPTVGDNLHWRGSQSLMLWSSLPVIESQILGKEQRANIAKYRKTRVRLDIPSLDPELVSGEMKAALQSPSHFLG